MKRATTLDFNEIDASIVNWMSRRGIFFLRVSLGIVFFWFGALKFFPALSPAEGIARDTVHALSFGLLEGRTALYFVASLETIIGLGLMFGIWLRGVLLLLFMQMLGTFMPLILFPERIFVHFPYAPTLEGQYILKNIILLRAAIVIGATVRGQPVPPPPR